MQIVRKGVDVMGKPFANINNVDIFEHIPGKYSNNGKTEINSLEADGLRMRLYRFLEDIDMEIDMEDVYNNTSGIRNGNEVQLIDDYWFSDDIYISYLYSYNGTAWAVLYDKANNDWYGEFEI